MINEINFPSILYHERSLLEEISHHRDEILAQLNQYGGVLFRGFKCESVDYFSKAIELCALGKRCSTNDYRIPRTLLNDQIYTSTDLAPAISIPLHHEKPRSKNPPHHLYFYCKAPPEKGGETLFANANAIWKAMPETIRQKISQYGVLYKHYFYGRRGEWSEYFGTSDKDDIEAQIKEQGLTFEWTKGGQDLMMLNYLPGVLSHPVSKQKLWFNSVHYLNYYTPSSDNFLITKWKIYRDRLPLVCHYGNGKPFSFYEITQITEAIEKNTHALQWKMGDFLILDNYTYLHGKAPHEGKRLLYSCMTSYVTS